jgi:drug/metabolite transporter (DMT)-like permease
MNEKGRKRTFTVVLCLLLAAGSLVVFGHAKVISKDDLEAGHSLCQLYVSDFASHEHYGMFIKAGIGVFCVCVVFVLRDIASRMTAHSTWRSSAWLSFLGVLIVGGLAMVAYYDSRPDSWVKTWQDFFHKKLPDWAMFSGIRGEDAKRSDDLHLLGFCLFAAGFLSMAVTNHWIKRRSGRGFARKTLLFCLVCLLLLVWMCFEQASPGIPQRAFLVASAVWLLFSHKNYGVPDSATPSRPSTDGDQSRF